MNRDDVALTRRSLKWPVPDRLRQASIEMLWEAIDSPDVHVRTRIEAVKTVLAMDALNLQVSLAENENRPAQTAPAVTYILPPNGSEAPEPADNGTTLIEADGTEFPLTGEGTAETT